MAYWAVWLCRKITLCVWIVNKYIWRNFISVHNYGICFPNSSRIKKFQKSFLEFMMHTCALFERNSAPYPFNAWVMTTNFYFVFVWGILTALSVCSYIFKYAIWSIFYSKKLQCSISEWATAINKWFDQNCTE